MLERSTILLPVATTDEASDDGHEDEKDNDSNDDGDRDGNVEVAQV